jgi:4-hydroxy-4-methyl-2-oxoglutarate aldolase
MRKKVILILAFILGGFIANSQNVTWSPESIMALTPDWKGERMADGRPKVSDALLERLKNVSMEEAWGFLRKKGYHQQFENFAGPYTNGWEILHPEETMTGRVLTAQFLPLRPDFDSYVQTESKKEGFKLKIMNATPINALNEGDVYVADSYEKMEGGTLIGDNLGNAIYNASKRGIIYNGSVRDMEGLEEIKGFNAWIRGSDPSVIAETMLATYNSPIRIGRVTVLPGDVVLAKKHGVVFIPATLVAELVISSEYIMLHDEFNFQAIKTNRWPYKNEEFQNVTREAFDKAFADWLNAYPNLPMPKKELFEYIDKLKAEEAARVAAGGTPAPIMY